MSRTFKYYNSISYNREPTQEEKGLKMKKKQDEKIVSLTQQTSYVNIYMNEVSESVIISMFYTFTSSLVGSIIENIFENYLKRMMMQSGLEKKIKIKFGNMSQLD
jgi:hypothetical protein